MKKLINLISLIADLAPGAGLILFGAAIMVGGTTGVLWY